MSLMNEIVNDNNQRDDQSSGELLQKAMAEVYPSNLIQNLRALESKNFQRVEADDESLRNKLKKFSQSLGVLEDILFDLSQDFKRIHAGLDNRGSL